MIEQARRLLEIVRKSRAQRSISEFRRRMAKDALAREARKVGKGEVGGSNV